MADARDLRVPLGAAPGGAGLHLAAGSGAAEAMPHDAGHGSAHHDEHHDGGHHEHHDCLGCHGHGPLDQAKALTHASLGFEPVFNDKFNEERMNDISVGFQFLMRIMPLFIGLITAGCGVVVGFVSELIGEWRCDKIRMMITEGHGWGMAWGVSTGIMLVCALASALPVYCGNSTKTAGSSGIPQLIGLLNGVDLRSEFSLGHLFVKWWGVSLAVASGLAVGPEGPMIFIGSAVGAFLSTLVNKKWLWHRLGHPQATVGRDVYLRDYTSIGAGCGIAAAFRAPIAGTLFIVEEAASHFKKEEMALIFFGGLASLEVILLTGGFGSVLEYKVQTGTTCSGTPWWSIIFFCILGIVCGVFGAIFNWVNILVMQFRAKHCNPKFPMRRVVEIIVLCIATSSAWIGAAYCYGEERATSARLFAASDGCIKDSHFNQVLTGSVIEKVNISGKSSFVQKYLPKGCLYGVQVNDVTCPLAWDLSKNKTATGFGNAQACINAISTANIMALPLKDQRTYCCNFDTIGDLILGKYTGPGEAMSKGSKSTEGGCTIDLGESMPSLSATGADNQFDADPAPEEETHETFNEMASLVLVPFKVACQNLFTRGTPYSLSLSSIVVFFILFSLGSAVTAGCALPSGLLMPQMIIGGCIGRALTLMTVLLQEGLVQDTPNYDATFIWANVFRPFFGTGGSLENVLLTPTTAGYLDPGIGALVGAAAFLGGSGRVTLFTTVMMVEITGDPVMIFPVGFATVFAVIVGNLINHGLYHALLDVQSQPYLPDTWDGSELPPRIQVKDMMPRNDPIVIPINGGREGIHAAIDGNNYTGFPVVDEDNVVIGIIDRANLEELVETEQTVTPDKLKFVSDLYPVTVRKEFPLQMAYTLFKSMDMRSLVVVDDHHRPVAVMTRFAFLSWKIKERLGSQYNALWKKEEDRLQMVREKVERRRAGRRGANEGSLVQGQDEADGGRPRVRSDAQASDGAMSMQGVAPVQPGSGSP